MKKAAGVLIVLGCTFPSWAAEPTFSGDVSLVSTYVFRGVKQFSGAALQSTAEFSYGAISAGLWMSSFAGELTVENDPYVTVSLPTGNFDTTIGILLYSYDFFSRRDYTVYELSATTIYGPLSIGFFYSPSQKYKKGSGTIELLPDPLYWTELGVNTKLKGAELSALFGYGTYSAYFTTGSNEKTAACLLLSAGKSINSISLSWNWSLAFDEYTDNVFFLKAGYNF